jgi:hypothetical protein
MYSSMKNLLNKLKIQKNYLRLDFSCEIALAGIVGKPTLTHE